MTFKQCDDYRWMFGEMTRLMEDNVRYYKIDGALSYPSVTSVISFVSRKKFADWRARVGEEEANRKTKHATTRGTRLHRVFEEYLMNGDYKSLDEYNVPLINLMFNTAKSTLDSKLDNIYQQETNMYSSRLCLAGTVDLICEVDGELAIVDFKTSEKTKPEEWLEDYFVQLSAYWAMFAERTGVCPKKLVVILVAENGDVQIVERTNIMDYLKTLRNYVSQFIQYRDAGS
jgi:ATP-dependent exoDNAse (exonuclease V) beta subunit